MQNKTLQSFRRFVVLLAVSMLMVPPATILAADAYPTKPVRLVVTFAPGGSNDIVARLIATNLTARLGKQVIVENRAGAGGTVGSGVVAHAQPDGYTLMLISASYPVSTSLYSTLPYDPYKSFVPVVKLGTGPSMLVVHPSVPANTMKEFIALAKAKPGKLLLAAAGVGSFGHLGSELLLMMADIDVVTVQFKGGEPAVVDTLGGHSHIFFGTIFQSLPHVQAGKLRPLGTGGKKRSALLPDVPTISESGVPGYEANNWWGILAPAGTPKAIVERLHKEISAILALEEIRKAFRDQGAEAENLSSAEFGQFIAEESTKWAKLIKAAGIKPED